MPCGKPTPEPVTAFILASWQNASGLTYDQIADKVQAKFHQEIDKSTVGKILKRAGLDKPRPEIKKDDLIRFKRLEEHEQFLVEGLSQLGPPSFRMSCLFTTIVRSRHPEHFKSSGLSRVLRYQTHSR